MIEAARLQAPPAAVRNAGPILDVLTKVFAPPGFTGNRLLEIAAGSGYHAAAFAGAFPALTWQPSDPDAAARASIAAYIVDTGLANLQPPLALDVLEEVWPIAATDAVLCINMIHISPWEATLGLLELASGALRPGGLLLIYGPFRVAGVCEPESNATFDATLRGRNAAWGYRDVEVVEAEGEARRLQPVERIAMPSNNFMLVLRKA